MKTKKLTAILLILVLALSIFACSDDKSNFPTINVTDRTNEELAYVKDDTMKTGFPAAEWTGYDYTYPLTVMYNPTIDVQGGAVNINVQNITECKLPLDEEALSSFKDAIEQNAGYADISVFELRTLNDENVIYLEMVTTITDEVIDQLIKNGVFTEDQLNAIGGRDVLKQTPPTNQVSLYAVVNERLCLYTGTYYKEEQKQVILDTINVMISTMEFNE